MSRSLFTHPLDSDSQLKIGEPVSKRRKKKKYRKQVLNEGESDVKLLVAKIFYDYNNGILTDSELDSKILDLVFKLDVGEVAQYLPASHTNFLKNFIITSDDEEEHVFIMAGCFGPEFDFEKYMMNRKKITNKAIRKIKEYYSNRKK